jgi:hypothetical protein
MNKLVSFLKKKDLYLCIARYVLGGEMMGYGLLKIIGLQTKVIIPFSAWQHTLEETTGPHLTWAFLGYSLWLPVLLGLFEFVPAALLLFRRTSFLGALLLFPMTLSVFLINYSLNLWRFTKRLSLLLLLLNVIILVFERRKLKLILDIIIDKTGKLKGVKIEMIVNVIIISGMIAHSLFPINPFYNINEKNALIGNWLSRHPFEWTLVSEKINDSTAPHHLLKAYFGPKGFYSEINDSTNNGEDFIHYSINEKNHLLKFDFQRDLRYQPNAQLTYYYLTGDYSYDFIGDTILCLQKTNNDSSNNSEHKLMFKRRIMNMPK